MNSKLIIFVLIIQISGLNSLTTKKIWSKAKKYINQGKVIVDKNKTHFIFDESNYTKLDINSTKMQDLYKMQEQIFKEYNITSYIFIVDYFNLDDSYSYFEPCDDEGNLKDFIVNEYKTNYDKTIVIIIDAKESKLLISKFPRCKYRQSDPKIAYLQLRLYSYMRKNQYYKVLKKIIEYIYNLYSKRHIIKEICLYFIIIIVFILIMYFWVGKKENTQPPKTNRKNKINDEFLRLIEQQNDEKTFNEFCPICSLEFSDNNDEERIAEDLDSVRVKFLDKNENEKIEILECGHKFHSNCISTFKDSNNLLNNNCPLCKEKKRKKYK